MMDLQCDNGNDYENWKEWRTCNDEINLRTCVHKCADHIGIPLFGDILRRQRSYKDTNGIEVSNDEDSKGEEDEEEYPKIKYTKE